MDLGGFVYYSDFVPSIKVLHAVAMKYVLIFKCRSLFIDESIFNNDEKILVKNKYKYLGKLNVCKFIDSTLKKRTKKLISYDEYKNKLIY